MGSRWREGLLFLAVSLIVVFVMFLLVLALLVFDPPGTGAFWSPLPPRPTPDRTRIAATATAMAEVGAQAEHELFLPLVAR